MITAKHHEGYAMWDSDVASLTDTTGTKQYKLRDYSGYQPDLLAQLSTERENRGGKSGLYRTAYITDMKAQSQELLDRYDPAVLWFDGDSCGNPSTPTPDATA